MDKIGDALTRQAGAWNPTLAPVIPNIDSAESGPQTSLVKHTVGDSPGSFGFDRTLEAGQVLQEHTQRGKQLAAQVECAKVTLPPAGGANVVLCSSSQLDTFLCYLLLELFAYLTQHWLCAPASYLHVRAPLRFERVASVTYRSVEAAQTL